MFLIFTINYVDLIMFFYHLSAISIVHDQLLVNRSRCCQTLTTATFRKHVLLLHQTQQLIFKIICIFDHYVNFVYDTTRPRLV